MQSGRGNRSKLRRLSLKAKATPPIQYCTVYCNALTFVGLGSLAVGQTNTPGEVVVAERLESCLPHYCLGRWDIVSLQWVNYVYDEESDSTERQTEHIEASVCEHISRQHRDRSQKDFHFATYLRYACLIGSHDKQHGLFFGAAGLDRQTVRLRNGKQRQQSGARARDLARAS